MLRITECISAGHAKDYFKVADYYTGQELAGVWGGEGAKRLGLSGDVDARRWERLCDNLHPETGKPLTVRTRNNRRIGYDFNWHIPKSLSLLSTMSGDERLITAFTRAVDETMREAEAEMKTRVRLGKANEDRVTGNMVWGRFVHLTSRPVGGVSDPHLHAHVFVQSATFDEIEQRWKSGQFGDLKRDGSYFEARFHARLSRKMQELGLPVIQTAKGWEIAGFSKATLRKFSRRTQEIEKAAAKYNITSPQLKAELGGKTRERKQKEMSVQQLRAHWESMLTADEKTLLQNLTACIGGTAIAEQTGASASITDAAISHVFERKSVVPERQLITEAIKRSVGFVGVACAEKAVAARDLLVRERQSRRWVTTLEVLNEEKQMLEFARRGRGTCRPFVADTAALSLDHLNQDQQRAVRQLVGGSDRVTIISGKAGTGKTTALKDAVKAIEASGTPVFAFSPTAEASRGVLAREGFANADTVARLLVDKQLQSRMNKSLILVDEAGMLGVSAMKDIFNLAASLEARVLLVGDTAQHGSVDRGAALRLLETESGLSPASIKAIQRQRGEYKKIVELIADGKIEKGCKLLDQQGWIYQLPDPRRYAALAAEYICAIQDGKSVLAISPTHAEGEKVTAAIRQKLIDTKMVGEQARELNVLHNTHLTLAQRGDAVSYEDGGQILEFHQNCQKFPKGTRILVDGTPLPLDKAKHFSVYRTGTLAVAVGDRLRITKGGCTLCGKHRVNTGQVFTVKNFDKQNNLVLSNGWVLAKEFGHLSYAYCQTSHSSQGTTVDRVLIAQSAESIPASSMQQWYVSISRGREWAKVFCEDKKSLLAAISREDERLSATELLKPARTLEVQRQLRNAERALPLKEISREGPAYER